MLRFFGSRLFSIWLLVLVLCAGLAEIGRMFGSVQRPILDGLFLGADKWWSMPTFVHIFVLLVLAVVFFLIARRTLVGVSLPPSMGMRILWGVIVVLGLFLCINQFDELNNVISRTTDFGTIYMGSAGLFHGTDPYTASDNGYFYPPLLAFLFGWLLVLPPAGASTLFFSVKFIMVLWTLMACDQLVQGSRFTGKQRTLFIVGLIFVGARFWMADLQFGNTNTVILFLMVAAVFFDRQDKAAVAGLVLALAVSIKILPAVLCLHFLVTGRWRTLLYFGAAMVGANVLPWLVFQGFWWDAWAAYFDVGVTGKLSQRLAQPDNQSLWGLINRSLPEVPLSTLRWVWFGFSAALVTFAGYVSFRSRNAEVLAQVGSVSLYSLVALLVSPGSWVVHYTAVLLPMTVLLVMAFAGLGPRRLAWSMVLVTNFAFTMSGWFRPTISPSINQSWFVMAAVLLIAGIGVWVLSASKQQKVA